MMSIWDAPSDRDHSEYLNPSEPEDEYENDLPAECEAPVVVKTFTDDDSRCPF